MDRKIELTAIQFLLVQNRQQTHDWTQIESGTNGLGIQECHSFSIGEDLIACYVQDSRRNSESMNLNECFKQYIFVEIYFLK